MLSLDKQRQILIREYLQSYFRPVYPALFIKLKILP